MHDLQLCDTTIKEISGGPVSLHQPPFSGVQNYKFNKLTFFRRTTQIPWRIFCVHFTWNAPWHLMSDRKRYSVDGRPKRNFSVPSSYDNGIV